MDNEIPFDHPLPDDILQATRALYAPPTDAAYWNSLESRIMARVTESSTANKEWWQVLHGWSRVGLAAAAAVLIAVSALLMHSHASEIRAAYDTMMRKTPTEQLSVPDGALGEREGSDSRDASFHDVISH